MSATMQALIVLEPNRMEIREVPVPEPGPNEVLARVRAVSICGTDAHLIHGDYPGFWPPSFPFIPGHEWAGEIAALGPGAERYGWQVGDRVAGTSHDACGGVTDGELKVTLSIGVASYPADTDDPSELVALSDEALYHAKRSGRNRVSLHRDAARNPLPAAGS